MQHFITTSKITVLNRIVHLSNKLVLDPLNTKIDQALLTLKLIKETNFSKLWHRLKIQLATY